MPGTLGGEGERGRSSTMLQAELCFRTSPSSMALGPAAFSA